MKKRQRIKETKKRVTEEEKAKVTEGTVKEKQVLIELVKEMDG